MLTPCNFNNDNDKYDGDDDNNNGDDNNDDNNSRSAPLITDVWFLIRASPTMTVEQAKFVGGQ